MCEIWLFCESELKLFKIRVSKNELKLEILFPQTLLQHQHFFGVHVTSWSFSHSHRRPAWNESTLTSCLLMIFVFMVFSHTHVTEFSPVIVFSQLPAQHSRASSTKCCLFSTSSLALPVSSVDQWAYTVIPVLWLVSQLSWLHLLPTHRLLWSLIGAAEVLKLPYYKAWILCRNCGSIVLNVLVWNKNLEHHDRRTFVDEHKVLIIIYNVNLHCLNTVVVR